MINISLTVKRYDARMSGNSREYRQLRTGKRASIWFALMLALAFHAMVFQFPFQLPGKPPAHHDKPLEIALQKPQDAGKTPTMTPIPEPNTVPEPEPVDPPAPTEESAVADTRPLPDETSTDIEASTPITPVERRRFEQMSDTEKQQLASSLLSQQFIREKPLTEQLFGKPLAITDQYRAEFHIPERPGMISMLDTPMPDLPFAYQQGLIHFAYDPGVKGDLQRFWDVITPEFGWRTRYGTEVRCIWVLIVGGCAWK